MKDQFYLTHATRTLGMGTRECGSGYERCASHNKSIHEFYNGMLETKVLSKFPPSARKWVKEIIDKLAPPGTPASSDAPSTTVVADLHIQIAVLSARFGSSWITVPPVMTGSDDFTTSDSVAAAGPSARIRPAPCRRKRSPSTSPW